MTSQVEWLQGLSEPELARLLEVRSDVSIEPPPRTFGALAHLLHTRASVERAIRGLDRGALSVLAALRENRTRTALGVRFEEGEANSTADLESCLKTLVERGLAWPSDDGYRTSPLYEHCIDVDDVPTLARPWSGEAPVVDGTAQQLAVARFCETADAVLRAVDAGEVTTVKAGGVGSRDIRTLSKRVDAEHVSVVELVLELAGGMGLVDVRGETVRATTELPAWMASTRAEKFASWIAHWWVVDGSPTNRTATKATAPPVLGFRIRNPSTTALRHAVVTAMPRLGVSDDERAEEYFAWTLPGFAAAATPGDLRAILQEATWLGVFAGHSPTALSVALARGEDIMSIAADVVEHSECTLRLLPDLTAVVTGPVNERISGLLTASADAETKDAASTWRFGQASVRRYLDGGGTAEELLAELAGSASTEVPQSLDYLIRDCARRHGAIVVRSATSVVVSEDESLIREIAALAVLKSTILAPTVLASDLPARRLLDELRAAGHSPTAAGPAATVTVSRTTSRTTGSGPLVISRTGTEPAVLAAALASGIPVGVDIDSVAATIRTWGRLAPREVGILAGAVAVGGAVTVNYLDATRGAKTDELTDLILHSGVVHGRSEGTNEWRSIELAKIRTVHELHP